MRTLVTGAAGFIGSTLVDRLLAEGHHVVGIDNLSTGLAANLEQALRCNSLSPGRFTFLTADHSGARTYGIVAGTNPDAVFHLAAQVDLGLRCPIPNSTPAATCSARSNSEATWRAGVRRFVYAASGGSRYGAPTRLPVDETAR